MNIRDAIVCIDPGHGGSDPGATYNGLEEKELALKISKYAEERLKSFGASVKLTRTSDTYLSLSKRTQISNDFHSDVFVSVHINATPSGTGIETWVHDNASHYAVDLANNVQNELIYKTRVYNRKVKKCPSQRIINGKPTNIYVVDPSNINAWAILTENLFIDNENDHAKLQDEEFLKKLGYAIAGGVYDFINNLPFEKV
ncbi:N-acetylmuramoyl-L-alanine amidase [Wukongibacter baidiensis]|uniref:N-acetylmuramoyl-L-alanine amidase n=1 Tax=Wukongibacter baidiensis TaxID=1723361 RepID=UPI003D7FD9D8